MKRNLIRIMPLIILSTFMVVFFAASFVAVPQEITTAQPMTETTVTETTVAEITMTETKLYSAELTCEVEVPAVTTTALESATFILSEDTQSMSYSIHVDGLKDPIASHIHG